MPGPGKYKVTKALGRSAKAGVKSSRPDWVKRAGRRKPTKSELAAIESKRVDEQQGKAREEIRKSRKKKPKLKPKGPFERLNEVLG